MWRPENYPHFSAITIPVHSGGTLVGARKTKARPAPRRKGRPPLPPDLARSIRIVTFVTSSERTMLDVLVAQRGTSLSALCYELMVEALKSRSVTGRGDKHRSKKK